MADNSWQTVPSRTTKKGAPTTNGHSKVAVNKKKGGGDSGGLDNTALPTFNAPTTPVFGEQSQYEALNAKEKKKQAAEAAKLNSASQKATKSSIPRPQKKDGPRKSTQKQTLESLLPSLQGSLFEDAYTQSKEVFRDAPLMWLKELTGQLNSHLGQVPQSDPTFTGRAAEYPSNLLKPDVKKVFQRSITECSPDLLKVFIDQLIQSVMTEMAKGLTVHGYQIVAQLVAKQRHDLFTVSLPKYLDLIVTNRNVPARCLTVMWILGQCGCYNFRSGLKVWTNLMLRVIGIKTLASYSVTYIGQILKKACNDKNNKIDDGYGVISMEDYFLLLDGVYATEKTLLPALQKQLKEYYPLLKQLAFGKDPKKVLVKFFPSFLARLTTENTNTPLQNEVLSNCVLCLTEDPHTLNVWREIYAKHLTESSVLLDYIAENWSNKRVRAINSKLLKQTINQFIEANETFNKAKPGRDLCVAACQRYNDLYASRAEESASKAKTVVILCLLVSAGLIVYDFYHHGGYKASKTHQLLIEVGMDKYVDMVYSQLKSYTSSTAKYLAKNVPKWTETAVVYLEPMFEKTWQYSVSAIKYTLEVTEPARIWMAENIPKTLDWVVMHPAWNTAYRYMKDAWTVVEPYATSAMDSMNVILDKARLAVASFISS